MINLGVGNRKGGIIEFIKTIIYALLLAGLIRTLLFQPFWIPSGSMKPTLLVGDFIFVNKFAYGYSRYSCPLSICPIANRLLAREPKRGDVVVFRHPVNGKDFVKRLIGLPGNCLRVTLAFTARVNLLHSKDKAWLLPEAVKLDHIAI